MMKVIKISNMISSNPDKDHIHHLSLKSEARATEKLLAQPFLGLGSRPLSTCKDIIPQGNED
jgi:hypothetical protein